MKAIVCTGFGPPDVLQLQEVAEARRYIEEGHKKGQIAIAVAHDHKG